MKLNGWDAGKTSLAETGSTIRAAFLKGDWPADTAGIITEAHREPARRIEKDEPDVTVRSSATARDLPDANFADQQETFLNIRVEAALLNACWHYFASPTAPLATALHKDSITRRSHCRSARSKWLYRILPAPA